MAKLEDAARKSGMFIFTDSDLKFDTPQFEMKIDAAKANRLGISMQDVGSTLATLLGGNYVNRFNLYGRSYEVIPQVPRDFRLTPDWLTRYQLRTAGGDLVPLSTVATVTQTVQPNSLPTFQQLNSATLQGVPFPGRTLGEALAFLDTTAKAVMPEGFTIDYQGESRQFKQEGNTLLLTFVFALIVIYLVLAAQFESFRDPFIILIALPTSMFGAMLPLNLLGIMGAASMNIYSQIGLVTLIGLISKHGILMVEFANRLQEQGVARRAAIETAAGVRLRPILMTTAAMVVAMVPLILAEGAGRAQSFRHRHRHRLRHGDRHDVHAVRDAGRLHADRAGSFAGTRGPGYEAAGARAGALGGGVRQALLLALAGKGYARFYGLLSVE